jgi:hypothetical protein
MTVDFYDDREEALDAEALAIFTEQPKYNVMHRKQAQRLKKLQGPGVSRASRNRDGRVAIAKTGSQDPRGRPVEDLAYLDSPEYLEFFRELEENARVKEQRRLAGTWSDCERREWAHRRAINDAIERGIDLDSPEFDELFAQVTSTVISSR